LAWAARDEVADDARTDADHDRRSPPMSCVDETRLSVPDQHGCGLVAVAHALDRVRLVGFA